MLPSAITHLRAHLGDPTAPIAVLTPSSINGAFARQQQMAHASPPVFIASAEY